MKSLASLDATLVVARDTARRALTGRFSLLLGLATLVCVALCLSLSIVERPVAPPSTDDLAPVRDESRELSIAFGAVRVPLFRTTADQIQFVQVLLARPVAGALGTFLFLIGSAGILSESLRRENVALSLTRPPSRAATILGLTLGLLALIAFHGALFLGAVWLSLGIRTGEWSTQMLGAWPYLMFGFVMILPACVLITVCTRSSTAAVIGSMLLWLVCFTANDAYHARTSIARGGEAAPLTESSQAPRVLAWTYWALPKPADLGSMLDARIGTANHFSLKPELSRAWQSGTIVPWASLLTSLLVPVALMGIACKEFAELDY